ncbi:hypothetical protein H9L10_13135 [Phycicoccus endophyticus]|uniref:PRC-barrel domain-containing protein n=1 Tax=Phycicoccus endophyticus TaxID=1690220 RepID=A0A7G9R0N5_9MICO|nr:PRC-barrel domain-containing protein [Phycicoccus endophyticus]NHI19441.1 hypothetical protein [Phycicoccus endophyticus]QNN49160.1 hypothetical protein H9L10_13135 [Phycicoccus endophyticus]GGL39203.1 hypothetical protein GCM10012283_22100 [Phycicoccus endophyticus]
MRASELLGRPVVDSEGHSLGPVRDLRLDHGATAGRVRARWVVVGGHELAHRLGYVDGRTRGPAVLARLLRGGWRDTALAVPVAAVASWGPDVVRLSRPATETARPVSELRESL